MGFMCFWPNFVIRSNLVIWLKLRKVLHKLRNSYYEVYVLLYEVWGYFTKFEQITKFGKKHMNRITVSYEK